MSNTTQNDNVESDDVKNDIVEKRHKYDIVEFDSVEKRHKYDVVEFYNVMGTLKKPSSCMHCPSS